MALKFAVNNSLSAVTSLPTAIPTGSMTLLQTQTASNSSSLEFTTGIDSTYDVYCFSYINCHPITDNVQFQINLSTDGGSNYNVTKTNSHFHAAHKEDDSNTFLQYASSYDLAQSTSYQDLARSTANADDESLSGYLHLFDPSNTTFVKHFIATTNTVYADSPSNTATVTYVTGYGDTTSAINAVDFKAPSGNLDSVEITLFGVA